MEFSHLCKVIIRAAVLLLAAVVVDDGVPSIGRKILAAPANKHCESIGTCKTSSKHESNVVLKMNAKTNNI